MKRPLQWMVVMAILSMLTACTGKIDSTSPENLKVVANTESPKEESINKGGANSDHTETEHEEKTSKSKKSVPKDSPRQASKKIIACQKVLEDRGRFSVEDGIVDYQSGLRIFPLLHFIMTKKSVPANHSEQSVFMKDNPIFVTRDDKYANSLVFATIHSQRTGVLHGVIGFPDNVVTQYYEPMVFGEKTGFTPQVPVTDVALLNKSVEVNRETWVNELAEYTKDCNDSLILPPTKTDPPFFKYNGKIYSFSKEIDFVAGVEGVGFGLAEYGNSYPGGKKIRIPILLYCPNCNIENVVMIQDGVKLKFKEDEYNAEWQKWLGQEWHAFKSEEIDFDEEVFTEANFSNIHSDLPPFISDKPSTIQVTINGEKVEYLNQ
ncbi:hypothetical protein SAMN04487970_10674 [Paenibacillus tianmuensis]|uniref:Lipoprotein n=1 Tax=Paenibacillus tianmuensis TaxID=624147 RepID=A0A1G4TTM8_9BACL|nr:hypothetical protein [Paenibacillus tianmuensis]SCW84698.1 hypothetical protein SAMN04487970_10674 [Paenibacillus tianmuensis]